MSDDIHYPSEFRFRISEETQDELRALADALACEIDLVISMAFEDFASTVACTSGEPKLRWVLMQRARAADQGFRSKWPWVDPISRTA